MKNILIVNIPAHGHVNPTIKLVKDLISFGNTVTYYCTEDFKEKIEGAGAIFKSYEYTEIKGKDGGRGDAQIFIQNSINMADSILSVILKETDRYDCLIYNSVLSSIGQDIAKKLNIKKTLSLFTTFAMSKDMVNEFISSLSNGAPINLDELSKAFKEVTKGINKKHNIEMKNLLHTIIDTKADFNLVFTSKYYQPSSEEFKDNFIFVGPSLTERAETLEFKLNRDLNKKLVYISLGTIDNQNLDFYKKTFEAFGSMEDIEIVLSVGKKTDINALGQIPKNFSVYNYVPQLEVLKQTDIFITHGGMNSSSEALYNSIPLIVVPQFGDQFTVGKRVQDLGAGILLPSKEVTVSKLKQAMESILDNASYKENAIKLGESLKNASDNAINVYKTI